MNVTIDLNEDEVQAFKAEANAAGLSVADWLRKIGREHTKPAPNPVREPGADTRPISEVIAEIMSDTPAEELAKLPKDGASQLDHYLYGHRKR